MEALTDTQAETPNVVAKADLKVGDDHLLIESLDGKPGVGNNTTGAFQINVTYPDSGPNYVIQLTREQ